MVFVGQKMPSKFFAGNKGEELAAGNTPTPVSSPYQTIFSPTPSLYKGFWPETYILSGPQEGTVIKDQASITFYFGALWKELENIAFETRVSEIDYDWQTTYSNKRSINFLPSDRTYIFQVRAKSREGIYDPTPAQRTFRAIVSPYLGKAKIISVALPKYFGQIMKIVLRNEIDSLNITGWSIESSQKKFAIPMAINAYDPLGFNQPIEITLKSGGYLTILGTTSPLGINFHLNKCFGYLTNFYDFAVEIPKNCPKPSYSEMQNLSDSCRNFIANLKSCQMPNLNSYDLINDLDCRNFVAQKLNYQSCLSWRFYDYDFFARDWYVYSGSNFLNTDHDELILRDQEGLFVDGYNY